MSLLKDIEPIKTKDYLKDKFKSYGLKPIYDNYLLEVPLSKMEVDLTKSFLSVDINFSLGSSHIAVEVHNLFFLVVK